MHTISSMKELELLDSPLLLFVEKTCPWLPDGFELGSIIVLEEGDDTYIHELQADLETLDGWEHLALFDTISGYWNAVVIIGQEDGYTFFMSSEFVAGLPELERRLKTLQID